MLSTLCYSVSISEPHNQLRGRDTKAIWENIRRSDPARLLHGTVLRSSESVSRNSQNLRYADSHIGEVGASSGVIVCAERLCDAIENSIVERSEVI